MDPKGKALGSVGAKSIKECTECGALGSQDHAPTCYSIFVTCECGTQLESGDQQCPDCHRIHCEAYKPWIHGKGQAACSGCENRSVCSW
jgi:hypothetical protein